MLKDIKMLLTAFAVLFVVILVFIFVIYGIESVSCSSYQTATGRETKMVFGNCYIKHNGQWYEHNEFSKINKIIVTEGEK